MLLLYYLKPKSDVHELSGVQVVQMISSQANGRSTDISLWSLWFIPICAAGLSIDALIFLGKRHLSGRLPGKSTVILLGVGLYPFYWFYSNLSSSGVIGTALVQGGFWITLFSYIVALVLYYMFISSLWELRDIKKSTTIAALSDLSTYNVILLKSGLSIHRIALTIALTRVAKLGFIDAWRVFGKTPSTILTSTDRNKAVEVKDVLEDFPNILVEIVPNIKQP